ncbi:MAG: hypothetical protein V7K98_12340 [Nostoc sp.]|uniref:hypothetical protein n=1 Tax=Nostoc sp. TaxID=1180 RepID=UPI002FF5E749
MTCTGRKGRWTISYTFRDSPRPDAIYPNSTEDDSPFFSNEGGQAILRSACDGRNMEPPYFAGQFSTVNITSSVFTPDAGQADTSKYDCINGGCIKNSAYNTPGLYASLSDCELACGTGCSGQCISNSDWSQIEGLASQIRSKECG